MLLTTLPGELLELEQTLTKEARDYNRTREIKDQIKYILKKPARDKILKEAGYNTNIVGDSIKSSNNS